MILIYTQWNPPVLCLGLSILLTFLLYDLERRLNHLQRNSCAIKVISQLTILYLGKLGQRPSILG